MSAGLLNLKVAVSNLHRMINLSCIFVGIAGLFGISLHSQQMPWNQMHILDLPSLVLRPRIICRISFRISNLLKLLAIHFLLDLIYSPFSLLVCKGIYINEFDSVIVLKDVSYHREMGHLWYLDSLFIFEWEAIVSIYLMVQYNAMFCW